MTVYHVICNKIFYNDLQINWRKDATASVETIKRENNRDLIVYNRPVTYFTQEADPCLAKPPLKFNGLTKLELTF